MEREIVYAEEVEQFLDELLVILFEKGYFGFPDTAKSYVEKLLDYVKQNIGILIRHITNNHVAAQHFE